MNSSKRSVIFLFIIRIFLSHLLWRLDHRFNLLLQITKHWSNYKKPEMTIETLQLIAIVVAAPPHKVTWLSNWNSGSSTREAFHFSAKGFLDKDLKAWLNKATFWARVSDQCPWVLNYVIFSQPCFDMIFKFCTMWFSFNAHFHHFLSCILLFSLITS